MSNHLALDTSKTRTGWALCFDGDIRALFDAPGKWQTLAEFKITKASSNWQVYEVDGGFQSVVFGSWVLGTAYTTRGGVFDCLKRRLAALHAVIPFDRVYVEEPITPQQLQGHTTIGTLRITLGLAAATEDFCHVYRATGDFPDGVRSLQEINIGHWRADFIGKIENNEAKAKARRERKAGNERANATPVLKLLVMERCQQLGFKPRHNDEGDAIGILTYGVLLSGETPPYLADEVLRQPLAAGAAR